MTTVQTTSANRHRQLNREARRATRAIAANFRRTARAQGTSVLTLRKTAQVTPWRMLWLWTGVHMMITDMFRVQYALDMSVEDVFEGTR